MRTRITTSDDERILYSEKVRLITGTPKYRVIDGVPVLMFRVAISRNRNEADCDCVDYVIKGKRAETAWKYGVSKDGPFNKGARVFHDTVVLDSRCDNRGYPVFSFSPERMTVTLGRDIFSV